MSRGKDLVGCFIGSIVLSLTLLVIVAILNEVWIFAIISQGDPFYNASEQFKNSVSIGLSFLAVGTPSACLIKPALDF